MGHAPRLPRGTELDGTLAATRPLRLTVALRPRDPAALAAAVRAISDPGSAGYHHYLSVAQFAARFGPTPASVAAVRGALAQSGLRVGRLSRNRLALAVSGSAGEVQGAFDTELARVRLRRGRRAYAELSTPTLPAGAAGAVDGVNGLDSLPLQAPEGLVRGRVSRPGARDLTDAAPCAGADVGYSPQQIADAYGLDGLYAAGDSGAGVTIGLYELGGYDASGVTTYEACEGITTKVTPTEVDGGASAGSADGEATLDIEDVVGLASGASVDVYTGPDSGDGPYDVWTAIVQADTAKVVSTSWGACEASVGSEYAAEEAALFREAAMQGQTILAAAGDRGSDDCDTGARAVDDPASQPDVTGVGGTSLPDPGNPADEPVWNDSQGAGGGGVSTLWSAPSWQRAVTGAAEREVPDVSADADPDTGYAIYVDGSWTEYGGTSAAAPTWAALVALAEASGYCSGNALGLINPALYQAPAADFDDVTSGGNGFDDVAGYAATTGYDMASGLGAPNAAELVPDLCDAPAGTTVSEPSGTSGDPGASGGDAGSGAGSGAGGEDGSGGGSTTTPSTGTTDPGTTTDPGSPITTTTTTTITPTGPGTTPTRTGPGSPATHGTIVELSAPARVRTRLGAHVRLALRGSGGAGGRLRYRADGLPRGLSLDSGTGLITGRPRRLGRYTVSVTVRDAAGDARSVVIRWSVTATG